MNDSPPDDSTVLQRALARRRELVQQLERSPVYQELQRLDAFIQLFRDLETGKAAVVKTPPVGLPSRLSTRVRKKSIIDAAAEICLEHGAPLPLGDLFERLRSRNHPAGGRNPKINLSSMLSRDPRFHNIPGRGWYPGEYKDDDAPPSEESEAS